MKVMKYTLRRNRSFSVMLLSAILLISSCIRENISGEAIDGEDITIKLKVGTRAATEDKLVTNNDDYFGSLAVYAFDENDDFVILHKFDMSKATNFYEAEEAFVCPQRAKTLLAIANYEAYPELGLALVKGLSMEQVKGLVASLPEETGLDAGNILMTGEVPVPEFGDATTDESKEVAITLHRLAARIDVYVFKAKGWDDDRVTVKKVQLTNGVSNTTLEYAEDQFSLPAELKYFDATGILTNTDTPEEDGDHEWTSNEVTFHKSYASFYTYRTSELINSGKEAKLAVTLGIGESERVYTAVVANSGNSNVLLDAGKVYQVKAVLNANGGIMLTAIVAPWEENGDTDWEFEFNYPSYQNPLLPLSGEEGEMKEPVLWHDALNEEEGAFSVLFKMEAPQGQKWVPVLDRSPADFTLKVYYDDKLLTDPNDYIAADGFYTIKVIAGKADNVDETVRLGITYTPSWLGKSTHLLINGGETIAWPNSGNDPQFIEIKQIAQP